MSTRYEQMSPEQKRAFEREQRKFIEQERMVPKIGGVYEEKAPRPVIKIVPAGMWHGPYTQNGVICAKRDIDIKKLNPATKEYESLKSGEDEQCVDFPSTRRCFVNNEAKAQDTCEKVKLAYACADETGGMLTPFQAAGVIRESHDEAKQCTTHLEGEGLLKAPTYFSGTAGKVLVARRKSTLLPQIGYHEHEATIVDESMKTVGGEQHTWLGERYLAMDPATRADVKRTIGTTS